MVKKKDVPQHIVDAAMELAAERGWRRLSLAEIAARAQLPLGEVIERFSSKAGILRAFLDGLDRAVVAGDVDLSQPVRDRLFEVVMRRLEAMSPHKAAIRVVLREAGGDPLAALSGARRFPRSMALMLETSGLSSAGLRGVVRIEGLAAIYLNAVRVWLCDDSPDAAKTMAALDRGLRRAESLVAMVTRSRPAAVVQHERDTHKPHGAGHNAG